jgi:peptidoglycan hydrolase-like protein with peptidoglycan-binding domain/DNA-directed RNA polymerase subunit F
MPSFSIHQFSSGILKPQKNQNGQWVSGGDNGDIDKKSHDVPQEIKDAVISLGDGRRRFGIPDAYPPQLGHYALIARELENYCVLAVANTQMDNFYRPFIAYRYFWLDKQEFQNQPNFADFDGIATLLYHWKQKGNPQYNIGEWTNSPEFYTTSWEQLKEYRIKTQFFQQKSTRVLKLISSINSNNQSLSYNEPLVYEANEIGGSLEPEEVHCLAIQYSHVKKSSINWAWNVRRLENVKDFRVIDCADDEALNWFNQELTKGRPRQNKDGEELAKYLATRSDPDRQPQETGDTQETEHIKYVLRKFRGNFTEKDVLELMNYYEKYKQDIVKFQEQFIIDSFSNEMPTPCRHNLKYVTLLAALDPEKNQKLLNKLKNLNDNLKENVVIKFLYEFLKIGTQNLDCFNHKNCGLFCKKITYIRYELLKQPVNARANNRFLRFLNGNYFLRNKSTKPKPVRNQYDEEVAIDAVDNPADPAAKTKKFFRECSADLTQEHVSQLMNDYSQLMNDYYENKHSIAQFDNEKTIRHLSNERNKMLNYEAKIKYVTLLTALDPQERKDILLEELQELQKFDDNFKKDIAIKFLDDFLTIVTQNKDNFTHSTCEEFYKKFTYTKFWLIDCLKDRHTTRNSSLIFLLLLMLPAVLYWRPNISISRTNISTSIITISTRRNNNSLVSFEIPLTFIGQQDFLAELLNEYDRQYEPLKLLELNQERSIVRLKKDILGKLLDPEAKEYISRLKDRDPNQVIDARKKEIYTSLKKFTPEIKTEILPVLKLKIQDEVNVTTLQNALKNNDNYTSGKQTYERGNFDIPTKKAVENLQRGYINTLKKDSKKTEIKKDGIVGPNTWNLLKDRLKDLQVETVYETLKNYLQLEKQTYDNIVSEIKKCQYSNQNEKALMFVNCLEELNKNYLARLLNKYDNQYKELEAWSRNQRINKKIKQEILDKFKDTKAEEYIKQLKHRYPSIVKDARKKEIYTNLEQFTPEIKTENLPVLKLGKQQQDEVDVTALQNALKRNINDLTVQETDERGNFDRPTKEAVENLQGRYIETLKKQSKTTKMKKDGIVGPNTWNLLKGRLKDLQVEKVYETLIKHLQFENQTDYNIVAEIKKCRDSNQNEKALKFVSCLEELKKNWNY